MEKKKIKTGSGVDQKSEGGGKGLYGRVGSLAVHVLRRDACGHGVDSNYGVLISGEFSVHCLHQFGIEKGEYDVKGRKRSLMGRH